MLNKLLKNHGQSIPFIALSLTGAAINYMLYPLLARQLSTSDFGDFTVTMALFNQTLSVMLAFNVISVSLVKNHDQDTARTNLQVIQKVLVWFFVSICIAILCTTPLLRAVLKTSNPWYFFILALLLLASVPSTIWSGYLQGHKKLRRVGVYSLSSAIGKVAFAVALAGIFGVTGGLAGVLFGVIVGTFILWFRSPIHLPSNRSLLKMLTPNEKKFLKGISPFIVTSLFVVGGLGVLQNIDITFAKILFDTQTAGVYSGVSIISNAIYFLSFLLVWLVLPEIVVGDQATNRRILKRAYMGLFAIAATALLAEYFMQHFLITALLGDAFGSQSNLLIPATLFQLSVVGCALYAFYLLVIRSSRSILFSLLVALPCMAVLLLKPSDPLGMMRSLLVSVLFGVLCYIIIVSITSHTRSSHEKNTTLN